MSLRPILIRAALSLTVGIGSLAAQGYKVTGTIPIGGVGGWDYLTPDGAAHRLYVTHNTEVDVVDTNTDKVVGKITGMTHVHGVALAKALNLGFISDGGSNQVVIFDLGSLQVKNKVETGTNPDGILYDSFTKRVFAFNGRSENATVIDATNGHVDGTIALGGKPEFPVSDEKGNIYDNIEDKNEIVQIDAKAMTVKAHWSIAPLESPSGLAIDNKHHRLFAVCDGKKMAVVNAETGKVVATPEIGDGPDAAEFDPQSGMVFSSNGDGTLTVIREDGINKFTVVENVKTEKGARTMALDRVNHKIYLATADFGATPPATAASPRPRPQMKPDTFGLVVVSK